MQNTTILRKYIMHVNALTYFTFAVTYAVNKYLLGVRRERQQSPCFLKGLTKYRFSMSNHLHIWLATIKLCLYI